MRGHGHEQKPHATNGGPELYAKPLEPLHHGAHFDRSGKWFIHDSAWDGSESDLVNFLAETGHHVIDFVRAYFSPSMESEAKAPPHVLHITFVRDEQHASPLHLVEGSNEEISELVDLLRANDQITVERSRPSTRTVASFRVEEAHLLAGGDESE